MHREEASQAARSHRTSGPSHRAWTTLWPPQAFEPGRIRSPRLHTSRTRSLQRSGFTLRAVGAAFMAARYLRTGRAGPPGFGPKQRPLFKGRGASSSARSKQKNRVPLAFSEQLSRPVSLVDVIRPRKPFSGGSPDPFQKPREARSSKSQGFPRSRHTVCPIAPRQRLPCRRLPVLPGFPPR